MLLACRLLLAMSTHKSVRAELIPHPHPAKRVSVTARRAPISLPVVVGSAGSTAVAACSSPCEPVHVAKVWCRRRCV